MNLNKIIDMDKKYYMNTFGNRIPVSFLYGKGINLWDTEGKKYTDFFAGIAVNALGYGHPAVVNAIKEQAEKLIHCSSIYYIETQARLAKAIVDNSCADKVFLANSGAEANEGAIKLARIFYKKHNMPEKYEIITLKKSFHGRTLTTVAATGQEKYQKPYAPLTPGFKHVELNNLSELESAISDATCAIMIEPIQGESGVHPATLEFVKGIRKLCDEKGLLLIFDEIQTGIARTGKLFAYEHFDGVEPDIFTLAKALGGGVPIGAVCAKDFVAKSFEPGDHGSTFGGNPLACAAGLAVLKAIDDEKIIENAEKMGSYMIDQLKALSKKQPVIAEVRGIGLMIGVELSTDNAAAVKNKLMEKGYLVGNVGSHVVRLVPPLILTKDDIDEFMNAFAAALTELAV